MTGLIDRTSSFPCSESMKSSNASATRGTFNVDVSRHRRFDLAQFVNLRRSGQLPESISHKDSARNLLTEEVSSVCQDCCDSGSDVIALNERRMPYQHTCNISDGVQLAGRQDFHIYTDFAHARAMFPGQQDHIHEPDHH